MLFQTLFKSSKLSIHDSYNLDELNIVAIGRYSEIYESSSSLPTSPKQQLKRSDTTPGEDFLEKSPKSDFSDRAIKLVRKKDYAISVANHEERSCTLLREIVLLWRGNYKGFSDDEEKEEPTFDKPFCKIYGILETRSDLPPLSHDDR
jgi:hypothetical protein